MKAYFLFWRKYVDFDGKTSRSEFFQTYLIHMLVSPVLMIGIPVAMMFSFSLDVDATMFVFKFLEVCMALSGWCLLRRWLCADCAMQDIHLKVYF